MTTQQTNRGGKIIIFGSMVRNFRHFTFEWKIVRPICNHSFFDIGKWKIEINSEINTPLPSSSMLNDSHNNKHTWNWNWWVWCFGPKTNRFSSICFMNWLCCLPFHIFRVIRISDRRNNRIQYGSTNPILFGALLRCLEFVRRTQHFLCKMYIVHEVQWLEKRMDGKLISWKKFCGEERLIEAVNHRMHRFNSVFGVQCVCANFSAVVALFCL